MIHYFSKQPLASELPKKCNNPFDNAPHPLAIKASKLLQKHLKNSAEVSKAALFENHNGKMFGVLVVADSQNKTGYLSAFSGMLNQQWLVAGFVPPVFDLQEQQSFLTEGEKQLAAMTRQINLKIDARDRQQALQQLNELQRQQDFQLSVLKIKNKTNKLSRKKIRISLQGDANQQQITDQLCWQSQQDKRAFKKLRKEWVEKISVAQQQFNANYENTIEKLQHRRKKLSRELHMKVFNNYLLMNSSGDEKTLPRIFADKQPAGGTGDCAAPKLIQYAHKNKLKILAMAEFWWGAPPAQGVRHHGYFYPPCRGKCHPILPFMLQGVIDQEKARSRNDGTDFQPEIIYEDDSLLVLNKPAGLLSIPGKQLKYSVLNWLKSRYPEATGALLVHRLDMATSGLLLAAKNERIYKHLQQQFIHRSVQKRYVALLSKRLHENSFEINLPLRVDLDDRPRQLVCYQYGKAAITRVRVISTDENSSRVYLYPLTGRTHQLRVHTAHSLGLNAPILGDELYGKKAERLMLHAEKLKFQHPVTGENVEFRAKVPF